MTTARLRHTEMLATGEPIWVQQPTDTTGDTFVVYPRAPGAAARTLRRGHLGRVAESHRLVVDVGDALWPAWQRSLREGLGYADGVAAADAAAANRRGREIVQALGLQARWRELREQVQQAFEAWLNRDADTLNVLAAAGLPSPDVRAYDAAVRGYDSLAGLVRVNKKGASHRNVAALGLRIAAEAASESGRVVDEVRAYLGVERWPETDRRTMWRRFLALGALTAAELDAAQAEMLALAPLPAEAEIGRLTSGDLLAASAFQRAYAPDDEMARHVASAFLRRATEVADHGPLIDELRRVREMLGGGIPEEAKGREFGGIVRLLERHVVDRRDALLAEQQRQAADGSKRRWGMGIEPYADGRVDLIELTTPAALADEGDELHHCVGGYSGRCASGAAVVWSLRIGGRRVATAELEPPAEPDGTWTIRQLAGFRNSAPSQEMREVATRLAQRHRGLRPGGKEQADDQR